MTFAHRSPNRKSSGATNDEMPPLRAGFRACPAFAELFLNLDANPLLARHLFSFATVNRHSFGGCYLLATPRFVMKLERTATGTRMVKRATIVMHHYHDGNL